MPRRSSPTRLADLVAAATRVFIVQGYRRTQMADVAAELGVAKGTVYLSVESKEALFDLILRCADAPSGIAAPRRLPIRSPRRGATLAYVRERLTREPLVAEIMALGARRRPADLRAELEAVLGKVYDVLSANRIGIKLVDRCAADHPGLADLWFRGGREGILAALRHYFESRAQTKGLRHFQDAAVVARLVLETLVFWAVHRHWDPSPMAIEESVARSTVIRFLSTALLAEGVP
jgi:AcrR family transcriptional regulator